MISERLSDLYVGFIQQIESFTKRKNWIVELTFIATGLALFFGFPSYELIYGEFMPFWEPVFKQAQHPFSNFDYNPITHEAKMTFRLFIPLLIKLLHLNILSLVILSHIAGILCIYFFIMITQKITQNKTSTVLLTLSFASIGVVKASFVANCGLFDGIAFCFMLLAILSTNSFLVFISVFFSSWIDERALIASSLLFIWHYLFSVSKRPAFAVVFAWVAYFIIRFYLAFYVGLKTHTAGMFSIIVDQTNSAPLGIFSGIEGFWVVVFLAFYILYIKRNWFNLLFILFPISIIIFVSLSVVDISRSMYYIFPIIFISLKILMENETPKQLINISSIVLLLSAIFPAYVVSGLGFVQWQYPLPLQLLRYFTAYLLS